MRTNSYDPKVVTAVRAKQALATIAQPTTATQLAKRLECSLEQASRALHKLCSQRLARCLNPGATRNRVFWLTQLGQNQQRMWTDRAVPSLDFPEIDWQMYANVCFSHRSAVIVTLTSAMQPSQIRRRAVFRQPELRMSANNVRDVIRYLKDHGVVRQIQSKRRSYPCYELTEMGQHFRRLLLRLAVAT